MAPDFSTFHTPVIPSDPFVCRLFFSYHHHLPLSVLFFLFPLDTPPFCAPSPLGHIPFPKTTFLRHAHIPEPRPHASWMSHRLFPAEHPRPAGVHVCPEGVTNHPHRCHHHHHHNKASSSLTFPSSFLAHHHSRLQS